MDVATPQVGKENEKAPENNDEQKPGKESKHESKPSTSAVDSEVLGEMKNVAI